MRRPILCSAQAVLLSLGLLSVAAPAQEEAAEPVRLAQNVSLGSATWVSLDLSVGDLKVQASDGPDLEVDLEVLCTPQGADCARLAKALKIDTRRRGDRLEVKLHGPSGSIRSKVTVQGTVLAPRAIPLSVELGSGDLEVSGFTSDLRLEVSVGNVQASLPERSVRQVEASAKVGDAVLRLPTGQIDGAGFVSKGLKWTSGQGSSAIEVKINVGNVELVLY